MHFCTAGIRAKKELVQLSLLNLSRKKNQLYLCLLLKHMNGKRPPRRGPIEIEIITIEILAAVCFTLFGTQPLAEATGQRGKFSLWVDRLLGFPLLFMDKRVNVQS